MAIRNGNKKSQKLTASSDKVSPVRSIKKGITTVDVLQIFPGAKIVRRSAEQQLELIGKNKN
jgi:hypothetical protein